MHGKLAVSCKSASPMEQQFVNARVPTPLHPDVVIGNPVQLEKKKQAIRAAGLSTLQVVDVPKSLVKFCCFLWTVSMLSITHLIAYTEILYLCYYLWCFVVNLKMICDFITVLEVMT